MMKKIIPLIVVMLLAWIFPACEAFEQIVHETIPPPDQFTPSGAVMLFKQAADSSDTEHALEYLCNKNGKKFSALERFDYGDELQRYLNRIRGRCIRIWDVKGTRVDGDTLYTVNAEFDWLFFWQFKTKKIGEQWYISEIEEENQ